MDGDAMAVGIARRLDHRLGRNARRPPAGAVRRTLHRAALRPRPPHRRQLAGRACGAGRDYKRYYYLLGSVGRKALVIAGALLRILLKRLAGDGPGTPLVFGIDDSPTKRYGPHVEARQHHNPTPGTGRGPSFPDGHVWVCLARLVPDTRSGSDRPADPLALLHPGQGYRLDGGVLRLGVPHQAGGGRRPD